MKNIITGLVLLLVATIGVFFLFSNDPSSGVGLDPSAATTKRPEDSSTTKEAVNITESSTVQASSVLNDPVVDSEVLSGEHTPENSVVDPSSSPFESLRLTLSDFKESENLDVDGLLESLAQGMPGLDRKDQSKILANVGEILALHPDATEAVLGGMDSFQDKGMVVRSAVQYLVDLELDLAAEWSTGLQDASLKRLAVNRMSAAWAEKDLDGVIEWASGLEDRQDMATALDGITWTWAQKDPSAVYEYASQIEDDYLRNQMFLSAAKMMAFKDPEGTTKWAAQFPTGTQEREQALSYSLFQWANKDVMAAVDFALGLEDPKVRDSGLLSVARSWAVKDPAAATEWAESFENDAMRRQAWASSTAQWAQKDPQGLAQWMQGRSIEEVQGHVMRQAIGMIGRNDPQQAQDWIQNLGTPELQQAASDAMFELQQRQVKQGP